MRSFHHKGASAPPEREGTLSLDALMLLLSGIGDAGARSGRRTGTRSGTAASGVDETGARRRTSRGWSASEPIFRFGLFDAIDATMLTIPGCSSPLG